MYHIAICDDNVEDGKNILEMTKQILFDRNLEAVCSLFESPYDLLEDIRNNKGRYDLMLLDILMGKMDGIQLAKALRAEGSRATLIYTSVSSDYAIDGYKVQASDYLLKPIDREVLADSIDRVLKKHDSLFVEVDGVLKKIQIFDVQYVEAAGNYVVLKTSETGETARVRATLSEAQSKLGQNSFARCHKGYLVNLGQIREVRLNHIILHSGDTVPLGRQYRAELQKNILEYIEKSIPG